MNGLNFVNKARIKSEIWQRNVAESKAKKEHTEHFPDLNADKPAKAEETFDADSSKFDTTFTTDSEPLTLGFYFPQS